MNSTQLPDQYGVVGHPVAHSWSPFIHGMFARQTGESLVYRLHDVLPESFRSYVLEFFSRGGRGLNVTVLSNMGHVDFGVIACRELVPDVWQIADGFGDAVLALRKLADEAGAPPAPKAQRKRAAAKKAAAKKAARRRS